jgi:hypothetical protein
LLSATAKSVTLTKLNAPAAPTTVSGVAAVCSYVGTSTNVTYTCTTVTGATGYVWTVPAGVTIVSGHNTNSILVRYNSLTGTDSISVQASSGCVLSAKKTIILAGCLPFAKTTNTTINQNQEPILELKVSPNPTTSYFKAQVITSGLENVNLRLMDIEGRLIRKEVVEANGNLNFGSELKPGVYILEALQGEMKRVVRVVKY